MRRGNIERMPRLNVDAKNGYKTNVKNDCRSKKKGTKIMPRINVNAKRKYRKNAETECRCEKRIQN